MPRPGQEFATVSRSLVMGDPGKGPIQDTRGARHQLRLVRGVRAVAPVTSIRLSLCAILARTLNTQKDLQHVKKKAPRRARIFQTDCAPNSDTDMDIGNRGVSDP